MPEIEMSTLKASPELRDQQNCILQAHWMRDEGLSPVSGRDTDRTVTTGPLVFSLVQAGLHRGCSSLQRPLQAFLKLTVGVPLMPWPS